MTEEDDFLEEDDEPPCIVPVQPKWCLDLALIFWARTPGGEQVPQVHNDGALR